jgi:hypothetical protein
MFLPIPPMHLHLKKLKLKLSCDRRSVGQSVLVWGSHLELMNSVWQLRISWCRVPSLTRGRICNLLVKLLLSLARAVTLGSMSRRTHGHILLSHLRLPQPGGPGPCIYFPQEQGGPVIPPRHWVPFSSPLTTRRATVEEYSSGTDLVASRLLNTEYVCKVCSR